MSGGTHQWSITLEGVTKKYGSILALRGIDLKVKEGEFLTIFGPNGAGKTTLLKILATLTHPTAGKVYLNGLDVGKHPAQVRSLIGLVPHQTLLYDDLTAYENLKFYARMYQIPRRDERIHEVIEQMGLGVRLHDRVGTFSRGMQQRLSIARAMLHDPRIVLLDEPETGLDQQALELFTGLICSDKCRTVVMATHRLEQGLEMAQRVIILVRGRIAYEAVRSGLTREGFAAIYSQYTRGTP